MLECFRIIVLLMLLISFGCKPKTIERTVFDESIGTNGILCLTFDDRHFDSWTNISGTLRKYNARVTFFPCGKLTDEDCKKLKFLHDKEGHSIGCHSVSHGSIPAKLDRMFNWCVWYTEIYPQVGTLEKYGIVPQVFAYPYNDCNERSDKFLLDYFKLLRVGVHSGYTTNGVSIVELADVFYRYNDLHKVSKMKSVGVGDYYSTDVADICRGIERIATNNEVLVLFSHGIYDNADFINMKTEWLVEILECCRSNNVSCVGMDELPFK